MTARLKRWRGPWWLALLALLAAPAAARDYYLDPAGNDRASGASPQAAWATLERLQRTRLEPGDRVFFKRGGVWFGSLTLRAGGEPGRPVYLGPYGNPEDPPPRVDGRLERSPAWEALGGGLWRARPEADGVGVLFYQGEPRPPIVTLEFASPPAGLRPGAILLQLDATYRSFHVTAVRGRRVAGVTLFAMAPDKKVYVRQIEDGRERQWAATLSPPRTVRDPRLLTRPGDWYWDPEEGAVYLRSERPPDGAVRLGVRAWGLRISRTHDLVVEGLEFVGQSQVGVWLDSSQRVVLRGLRVYGTGAAGHKTGVLLFNSSHCTLERSTVERTLGNAVAVFGFGPGERAPCKSVGNRIAGNRVLEAGSAGISLATDFPAQAPLVAGNVVEGNQILRANRLTYDAAGIYTLFVAGGNVIRDNLVRDGGTPELRSAGVMLDVGTGPTRLEGNRLEGNSNAGLAVTGGGHELVGNDVRHNCAPSWSCAQLVFFPVRANAGALVEENRLEGGKLLLRTRNPRLQPAASSFAHNLYVSGDARPFCWSDGWECETWLGFAAWRRLGLDSESRFRKP